MAPRNENIRREGKVPIDGKEGPPLEMIKRFGGYGGTVLNAYSETDQLEAAFQLDNNKAWDPVTQHNFRMGHERESSVMIGYLELLKKRENLEGIEIEYAHFAIHPVLRFLRATPDGVVFRRNADGTVKILHIVQVKFKAGSERTYRVIMHQENCTAKGVLTAPCTCMVPPQYSGQVFLEMFVTGMTRNDIAVGSEINTDSIRTDYDSRPNWWEEDRGPDIMSLYNRMSRWFWEDDKSAAATAQIKAFVLQYNGVVKRYNAKFPYPDTTKGVSAADVTRIYNAKALSYNAKKKRTEKGMRLLVDIDRLLAKTADPDDVKAMRSWRALQVSPMTMVSTKIVVDEKSGSKRAGTPVVENAQPASKRQFTAADAQKREKDNKEKAASQLSAGPTQTQYLAAPTPSPVFHKKAFVKQTVAYTPSFHATPVPRRAEEEMPALEPDVELCKSCGETKFTYEDVETKLFVPAGCLCSIIAVKKR